jgi:hypothetical protein
MAIFFTINLSISVFSASYLGPDSDSLLFCVPAIHTTSLWRPFRLLEAMIAPDTVPLLTLSLIPAIAVNIAFSTLNAPDKL